MKLISWNVNGIRAIAQKGFESWFRENDPDILCIQETKARREQFPEILLSPNKYHASFFSAQRPGYSSLVTYSRKEPTNVIEGMDAPDFDKEGRVLQNFYGNTVVINAYFPNSQEKGARLSYKLEYCQAMLELLAKHKQAGRNIILAGDYNIAHKPIDLKRPKENEGNAGYLPEERAWMDTFTGLGYIDVFRHFNDQADQYTWWSYRQQARSRNVGWRIDYFCVNPELKTNLVGMTHLNSVMGSDHCPIELILKDSLFK